MIPYRLTSGNWSIAWGTPLDLKASISNPLSHRNNESLHAVEELPDLWEWDLPEGVYRAKDIVRGAGIILAAIGIQLGDAANSKALLDNLQSSLATAGREAVLPLEQLKAEHKDDSRSELSDQAKRIGDTIANWAREEEEQATALKRYGERTLRRLTMRSRCDQHLWTPDVVHLLTGPSGSPAVMQLFNEYLHQLILLRDALLPFENWEEVPLERRGTDRERGLRWLEEARNEFLAVLLTRKIPHKAIVRYAQRVLSPELSAAGYGFQYRLGTILPASIGRPIVAASKALLRWHPVWTYKAGMTDFPEPATFDYALDDYYAAQRSALESAPSEWTESSSSPPSLAAIREAGLVPVATDSGRVQLQLILPTPERDYAVDLGQALRGHRYLYRPQRENPEAEQPDTSGAEPGDLPVHEADSILILPGLVTGGVGVHSVAAYGNPLVQWALLGKLYPENVVASEGAAGSALGSARESGKGFGAKFLVDGAVRGTD
ncbi:hypothetical protein G5B47_15605 [Paenibacillus sp. 7124]|uniref:Uncharacterized protein n=1 Tax=Paenibacillus apii TaxID=1850370 RepID=A0A6M1PNX3_9BACL|nr:hypothetical protein [Paenibacillus apii]NGM83845.1 hypothetical protein [Paenibacillus apii]